MRAILTAHLKQINRQYREALRRDLSREVPWDVLSHVVPAAAAESPSGVLIRAEVDANLQRALASLPHTISTSS